MRSPSSPLHSGTPHHTHGVPTMQALEALRALARYQTHGGYTWAAVMSDGELMCTKCVRENYREIYAATKAADRRNDWECIGITNDGECEEAAQCAQCHKTIWDAPDIAPYFDRVDVCEAWNLFLQHYHGG